MQPEKHAKENIPNEGEGGMKKNFNKLDYKYEMLKEKHKDVVFRLVNSLSIRSIPILIFRLGALRCSLFEKVKKLLALWAYFISEKDR